jgi:hypothetical protein
MRPYEFAQQQGQVIGKSANDPADAVSDPADLMDLLFQAFCGSKDADSLSTDHLDAVALFAQFSNDYLAQRRVASTGVVDGGFALVFEDGQSVQLASTEPAEPVRPDSTFAITKPKESKMKGMTVVDTSVPITTGRPDQVRKPRS